MEFEDTCLHLFNCISTFINDIFKHTFADYLGGISLYMFPLILLQFNFLVFFFF